MTVRNAPPNSLRQSATLAVLAVAQFLIALDYSIIYLALPSIANELRFDSSLAQWVVSAYAVPFAGFLVVGGRLADRFGAKRMFIAAVVVFGVASAIGGAAGDAAALLAARGIQGLAAAALQPAVLGLIGTTFPTGPARGRALAVWGSVGAGGLAAGVILGGALTAASWRLTLVINVPFTLLCAVGAAVWIGASGDRRVANRVPIIPSALGTGAVLALALGLTFGFGQGWHTIGCLGFALVAFSGFVSHERTAGDNTPRVALIEPVLRHIPSLRVGAVVAALYMASVGSEFYLLTLLLQSAKGYPPLWAGFAFLPLALMVAVGSTATGRAVRRYAPGIVLTGGFVVAVGGLLWISLALYGDSYAADLLPGLALSGFGHGVIYTSMFIIGTHDVPTEQQSTAGALLTTAQYLAGALTVAVLTLVLGHPPGQLNLQPAFLLITVAAMIGAAVAAWWSRPGRRDGTVGLMASQSK